MSSENENKNTRQEFMHSITPHLICDGAAEAIEFYKAAFGAEELMRVPAPNGKLMHGSVRIGDSLIMLVDQMPEWNCLGPKAIGGSPVTIHLMVDDVDAVFAQAVKAGGTAVAPPADMFWGDRYSRVDDPFGHTWAIATHIKDLTREEILEAAKGGCQG